MRPLVFILILFSQTAWAQWQPDVKCDYQWVFGTFHTNHFPMGHKLSFTENHPVSEFFDHSTDMYWANSSISDQDGNLLFFTNGMSVADRLGHTMPHGDSINYGNAWIHWHSQNLGYKVAQDMVILPLPGDDSVFYIFHIMVEIPFGPIVSGYGSNFYMTVVDMRLNNQYGDVVRKNFTILEDSLSWGMVDACRHANGRDWWILVQELNTNSFYRYLFSPKGIQFIGKQSIGTIHAYNMNGKARFSPDGERYCIVASANNLEMNTIHFFQFDRCTGLLCDFRDYSYPSTWLCGFSFSPNSQFIYYNSGDSLYQLDLTESDSSQVFSLIGIHDGFTYPFAPGSNIPTYFGYSQTGPDSKIYFETGQTPYLHIIEKPDVKGTNCQLQQHALQLNNITLNSIPTFPNYRLGRLEGSPCDTLGIYWGVEDNKTVEKIGIKAFPNPAITVISFELEVANNHQPMQFQIYDQLGTQMDVLYVAPFQGIINYNVSKLTTGMYFGLLKQSGDPVGRVRFVVE